ncbi:XrtA/PEP-CTERM system exopolysaccharide export protein [Halioxenophilus sp. WMMB6]|uniref:XrtA/PEP-CTERM system exopolysaccharide export protein n=1 Tax=Halioxenophilus sp. WMMB6 TaxID=3073815 RepID=UPI00295E6B35|nr:XrtA/PEP-CTERM system exopolysaccharide export protein [Halioxenophilus sp. WMMB6]
MSLEFLTPTAKFKQLNQLKPTKGLFQRLTSVTLSTFLALIFTACSSQQVPTPIGNATPPATVEYLVGIGDQLSISVWRNPDLSVSVPVRPDGKISVPLAGDVSAAGKTPEALAADITTKLGTFLKGPQVTVIVTSPASADFQRRVRVTGAVNSPVSLPYREGMTILDLVLLADGLNDFAAGQNAKLYRKSAGKVTAYPVNLDDLLNKGKLDANYPLQPSDVLSVPERLF